MVILLIARCVRQRTENIPGSTDHGRNDRLAAIQIGLFALHRVAGDWFRAIRSDCRYFPRFCRQPKERRKQKAEIDTSFMDRKSS